MALHIEGIVVDFEEQLFAVDFERAKIMLGIWIVVAVERIEACDCHSGTLDKALPLISDPASHDDCAVGFGAAGQQARPHLVIETPGAFNHRFRDRLPFNLLVGIAVTTERIVETLIKLPFLCRPIPFCPSITDDVLRSACPADRIFERRRCHRCHVIVTGCRVGRLHLATSSREPRPNNFGRVRREVWEERRNDRRECYRSDRLTEVDNQRDSWRTDGKGGRKRGGELALRKVGVFNGFLSGGEVVVKRPFCDRWFVEQQDCSL